MHHAVKVFGPKGVGVTPDKLLMFTNVVSAGMVVAQAFATPKDPVMTALSAILEQLRAIQMQLERIEDKLDDLSDLVLVGFERVLANQVYLQNRMNEFEKTFVTHIQDEAQRRAIQTYLSNFDHLGSPYKPECSNPTISDPDDVERCLIDFMTQLSTRTLFSALKGSQQPAILSPTLSNHMLSPRNGGGDGSTNLVLEQLSYPLFFSDNPVALRRMIARNHEAVMAQSAHALTVHHPTTIPNAEILIARLDSYLAAADVHPKVRSRYAVELTDEAVQRIDDIESALKTTSGNTEAITELWRSMVDMLGKYDQAVKSVYADFADDPFTESRSRFNEGGRLRACPTSRNWPNMAVPRDPVSGLASDKFVPQVYWIAQDLGWGTLSQCYEILPVRETRKKVGRRTFVQLDFQVKIFFNPGAPGRADRIADRDKARNALTPNEDSMLVALQQLRSEYHYSTYDGYARDIYPRAWFATAAHEKDVFECWKLNKNLWIVIPDCPNSIPAREIPQREFLTKSKTRIIGADSARLEERMRSRVHRILREVVISRSAPWDPRTLSFIEREAPNVMVARPVMKHHQLAEELKNYAAKFYLAKALFLTNFYHQNRMGQCMSALDAYAPVRVANYAAENMMQADNSVAAQLNSGMQAAIAACSAYELSPELKAVRSRLKSLRELQLSNVK